MVDGDPATTWTARGSFPRFRLTLPSRERLRQLQLTTNNAAPASRPSQVLVVVRGGRSEVVPLDADGRRQLPPWTTRSMSLVIRTTERAFQVKGTDFVEAPPGVSELPCR